VADDSGGLTIPSNENYPEWTFEQVLKALTDEGADLHTPAKASYFNVNTSPGASDTISYHAWGDYYYGVNLNNDTMTAWTTAINTIDEMMPDVARGKRGSMDLQSIRDLEGQIMAFGVWSAYTAAGMNMWANRLDSDDEGFRGKAASVIQWRLKANGDGLTDTEEQVFTRHGRHIALAVGDAATELAKYNQSMSNAWTSAMTSDIRNWIQKGIDGVVGNIYNYIVEKGLQKGQPGYKLDAFAGDIDSGKPSGVSRRRPDQRRRMAEDQRQAQHEYDRAAQVLPRHAGADGDHLAGPEVQAGHEHADRDHGTTARDGAAPRPGHRRRTAGRQWEPSSAARWQREHPATGRWWQRRRASASGRRYRWWRRRWPAASGRRYRWWRRRRASASGRRHGWAGRARRWRRRYRRAGRARRRR
jgi:hypothetical protein